jgi:hypothetical protein
MASATAKVPSANARHVTSDMASTEATDVTSAKAADVTSAEAADVASAKAAHVASVARRLPASTALAKTIITRPLMNSPYGIGGTSATEPRQTLACARKANANVAMD